MFSESHIATGKWECDEEQVFIADFPNWNFPNKTHQTNPKLLVKAVNAWVRSAFGNVYLILFSQLQMDCAKFDISLEEESWIGKKSPPSFAFIIAKKLMLYHLNHFISSETWLSYYCRITKRLHRYQLSPMILVSVSIDNVATPIVALLSGYLQHKLGPKVPSISCCCCRFCCWGCC